MDMASVGGLSAFRSKVWDVKETSTQMALSLSEQSGRRALHVKDKLRCVGEVRIFPVLLLLRPVERKASTVIS